MPAHDFAAELVGEKRMQAALQRRAVEARRASNRTVEPRSGGSGGMTDRALRVFDPSESGNLRPPRARPCVRA